MKNTIKKSFSIDSDETNTAKLPIILGIILVYLSTLFVQNTYKLSLRSAIIFTIVIIVHLLLFWFSENIFKRRYWLYFIIQGIIVFDCAVIMPEGYETVFLGLIPILVFQGMVVYHEVIKLIITSIFFYGIFCGTTIAFNGIKELVKYIPLFIIITIAIHAYSAMFLKQVKLRMQSQKVLKELELAYEKVEDLTLINERQRVARDLHDTLSQGLAGIIMQLEAVYANLSKDNKKRAEEIVQKAMEHARKTLADSRLVIDDLRFHSNTDMDFTEAVENEIAAFKAVSNTLITADISVRSQIALNISKHILYIVREALNNIAKHAEAKNAQIEIIETENQISIDIMDDGLGFDVKLLDELFGHYGILGITERVRAINGRIKIKSKKRFGTNIYITIPIEKGIDEEDE